MRVMAVGTGRRPPGPRAMAPDFCLPSAGQATRCLRDFLADGPMLLGFFRGHW